MVFLDTYENKVDRKGRVSVPASFRAQFVSSSFAGIVARPSPRHKAIEACDIEFMQDMNMSVEDSEDFYSEAQEDLAFNIFAESSMLSFDGEGRIILPAKLLSFAGISDRASFAGFGSTFLIWEPETLEGKKAESRDRIQKNGLGLRLRRSSGGKS